MVETDLLYTFVKKEDWLKATADRIMRMIIEGKLGIVYASRECLHELYYVQRRRALA